MKVGTKFRGLVNNELFEIVDIIETDNRTQYKIKHLKTDKVYIHSKSLVEHLLIEIRN